MRSRLFALLVLTPVLLVGVLAGAASAHPHAHGGSPVELEATRTMLHLSEPSPLPGYDGVAHFSVTERAVTEGPGISMVETGEYRCTQAADVIRCRGVIHGEGVVLGQSGTIRSLVSIVCNLQIECDGRGTLKGVGGELTDLRGTATSESVAQGVAAIHYRLYRI
ncbi:hypothetical protein [Geodermatophilus marinus]|uniref:hypothetical protein n=1 Tax=Geodermatophilus sp. LHW52908 TaxID=2303986 RepID=UPI000E3DC084|nr:hypothetical protein [Geodermatophilus sp. LHW52908]RFU23191.1 hypothetical protein D0Z06_00595 [Geodermatophilus sp. LHW52908]